MKLGLQQLAVETISIAPFTGRRVATPVHALVTLHVHRRRRRAALGCHSVGTRASDDGTLDVGHDLRRCTFGHYVDLDRVSEMLMTRAWSLRTGPGDEPMTIDINNPGGLCRHPRYAACCASTWNTCPKRSSGLKKTLWLWWSGPGESDLDLCWRAYLRRFSIEHGFRFVKNTLG